VGIADALIVAHFLWAAWMVAGIAVAALGFHWRRLWGWCWFRSLHLLAFVGTATTPLWNRGICPITTWEWQARGQASGSQSSFMSRVLSDFLYLDVSPLAISLVTAALALFTLVMFVVRPPWRKYA
jgi:hypothetical protein